MSVVLRNPDRRDSEELRRLFTRSISYAFETDGIPDRTGIEDEVRDQLSVLDTYLDVSHQDVHMLVAQSEPGIIGTAAYRRPNPIIHEHVHADLSGSFEISTVYVLPDHHGRGIGSLLFSELLICLQHRNARGFCLDCGYRAAQQVWTKKIGVPDVVLRDYWGVGRDHLIWHRDLRRFEITFSL